MSITEIQELFMDAGLLDTDQEENFDLEEVIADLASKIKKLEKQNEEQKKAIQSAYEIVPVDTLKKIEELEEEIKQNQKWFEEINELVEGDKEDPAVESVKDYVKIMNIAFNISIEENKKLKKLDTEAVDIISQLKQEKEELQAELKLAKGGFKLLECVDCKCIILDHLQGEIDELKENNKELLNEIKDIKSHWSTARAEANKLKEENEELKAQFQTYIKEAEKVEETIQLVGNQETIYACNKIWYGDEE